MSAIHPIHRTHRLVFSADYRYKDQSKGIWEFQSLGVEHVACTLFAGD